MPALMHDRPRHRRPTEKWHPTQDVWQRVAKLRQEGRSVRDIAQDLGIGTEALRRECAQELGLASFPYGSDSCPLSLADRAEAGDMDAAAALVERYARQGDREAVTALFRQFASPPRMR
jgi:hypothetical protein